MSSQEQGASPDGDRAGGPTDLSRDASQPSALIPSAGDDLASKTPEQIGAYMKALTKFISEWSKVVANAEESARKERELLMMAMSDLTKLAHFVARSAADVLEAQGTPTRSAETTGSVGEADGGAVPAGDAP